MSKVAKSYRNQWLDKQSPKFRRVYEHQIRAVDEMLLTGKPIEVTFKDWRSTDKYRRRMYEFASALGMRIRCDKPNPYTLIITVPDESADGIPDSISGAPYEKVLPVLGIGIGGDVRQELTPEQQEQIKDIAIRAAKETEGEIDTEDFMNKVFGKKGAENDEGDKP